MFALWLGTLLLIRLALALQGGLGLPDWVLAVVPLLFIYAPVMLCRWRGADSWGYRLSIPAFRDVGAWGRAARLAALGGLLIVVPWVAGYHAYQAMFPRVVGSLNASWAAGSILMDGVLPVGGETWTDIWRSVGPELDRLPSDLPTLVAYQVFFVAIPEEFFYRGYLQTRLNELHPRRFSVLATRVGVGAVMANLLFAFGHSVVVFQWWHFATFFPGLVFAWMRERSGGVVAGALFHAICNITVVTLDQLYGVG